MVPRWKPGRNEHQKLSPRWGGFSWLLGKVCMFFLLFFFLPRSDSWQWRNQRVSSVQRSTEWHSWYNWWVAAAVKSTLKCTSCATTRGVCKQWRKSHFVLIKQCRVFVSLSSWPWVQATNLYPCVNARVTFWDAFEGARVHHLLTYWGFWYFSKRK